MLNNEFILSLSNFCVDTDENALSKIRPISPHPPSPLSSQHARPHSFSRLPNSPCRSLASVTIPSSVTSLGINGTIAHAMLKVAPSGTKPVASKGFMFERRAFGWRSSGSSPGGMYVM